MGYFREKGSVLVHAWAGAADRVADQPQVPEPDFFLLQVGGNSIQVVTGRVLGGALGPLLGRGKERAACLAEPSPWVEACHLKKFLSPMIDIFIRELVEGGAPQREDGPTNHRRGSYHQTNQQGRQPK